MTDEAYDRRQERDRRLREMAADLYGVPFENTSVNENHPDRVHVGVRMPAQTDRIALMITDTPLAVDVIDELAAVARGRFHSHTPPSNTEDSLVIWRDVAQAVRDAAEPYQYPTPEAYEAACRALERHREAAKSSNARAHQLAIMLGDMLVRFDQTLRLLREVQGGDLSDDDREWITEIREQFDETCCTGGHAKGEPHVPFHKTGATP